MQNSVTHETQRVLFISPSFAQETKSINVQHQTDKSMIEEIFQVTKEQTLSKINNFIDNINKIREFAYCLFNCNIKNSIP